MTVSYIREQFKFIEDAEGFMSVNERTHSPAQATVEYRFSNTAQITVWTDRADDYVTISGPDGTSLDANELCQSSALRLDQYRDVVSKNWKAIIEPKLGFGENPDPLKHIPPPPEIIVAYKKARSEMENVLRSLENQRKTTKQLEQILLLIFVVCVLGTVFVRCSA
jgi:uncharacterized protein YdiU (UPF0061 family)